ncbi:hypothetical protein HYH03_001288 [Edaphochlamys debaryana]|uniref:Uncharacterized protein n=1 Tax=Edaphochlamys debaryana TaxID=47281 RepID=A0A835YGI0_9CHLO|nr:hypothetical protein HYH03_001288 [Edaphochlamys debaryana]|eukprot:KAG2500511.1 hypothetical protein HYH03_001288 [Edaphochlamys debaryana]
MGSSRPRAKSKTVEPQAPGAPPQELPAAGGGGDKMDAAAADPAADPAKADSQLFTEQLSRLRARLQSVVQGVREVAQSLDEPHSLITGVRDQLQSSALSGPHDVRTSASDASASTAGIVRDRVASMERQRSSGGGTGEQQQGSSRALQPSGSLERRSVEGVIAAASPFAAAGSRSGATAGKPSSKTPAIAPPSPAERKGSNEAGAAGALPALPERASSMTRAPSGGMPRVPATSLRGSLSRAGSTTADSTAVDAAAHGARSSGGGMARSGFDAPVSAAASAAVAAADSLAADALEMLGSGDASLMAATANAAAAAAYLEAHPETLRELWTLRARVRAQESEMASMVTQLSNKNAQLDHAQTVVQTKERELAGLTTRLTGVLGKLQTFQSSHQQQQQELAVLQQAQAAQQQVVAHAEQRRAARALTSGDATRVTSHAVVPEEEADGEAQRQEGRVRAVPEVQQHARSTGPSLEVYMPPPPTWTRSMGPALGPVPEPLAEAEPEPEAEPDVAPEPPAAAQQPSTQAPAPAVQDEVQPEASQRAARASREELPAAAAPAASSGGDGAGRQPSGRPSLSAPRASTAAAVAAAAFGNTLGTPRPSLPPLPSGGASAAGRGGRGLLRLLMQLGPSIACVVLLLRDPKVRRGLDNLRRAGGASEDASAAPAAAAAPAKAKPAPAAAPKPVRRGAEPAVVKAKAAAAPAEPRRVSAPQQSAGPEGESTQGKASRECKEWCKIVRPPPPHVIYY